MSHRYIACDEYGFRHLPRHLARSGRVSILRQMLLEFDWLQSKLEVVDINGLLMDYALVSSDASLGCLQAALRLSSHILVEDKTQLPGQLVGRLMTQTENEILTLLAQARQWCGYPWLEPLTPTLTSPNGLRVRTLSGHNDWINTVALTPDGTRIVSGSNDGIVKVWELESGVELLTFRAGRYGINTVVVTSDGKHILSNSDDNTFTVWDLRDGRKLRTFSGHTGTVLALAITQDGKWVVSASLDHTLKVWDYATSKKRLTFSGHNESVRAIAITPDGTRAVSASWDKTVKVWDLDSGNELFTLSGHSSLVRAVAIMPDGIHAVSASDDHTLRLWDIIQGREVRTLSSGKVALLSVVVMLDGRRVAVATATGEVEIWNVAQGEKELTLNAHYLPIYALALTPDGSHIISASIDQTLRIWQLDINNELDNSTSHAEWVTNSSYLTVLKKERLTDMYNPGMVKLEKTPIKEVQNVSQPLISYLVSTNSAITVARTRHATAELRMDHSRDAQE